MQIDIYLFRKMKEGDQQSFNFFPENYQTETHIQQWAIIEKHSYIIAPYAWNMFEFAVPMWNRGGVAARNFRLPDLTKIRI